MRILISFAEKSRKCTSRCWNASVTHNEIDEVSVRTLYKCVCPIGGILISYAEKSRKCTSVCGNASVTHNENDEVSVRTLYKYVFPSVGILLHVLINPENIHLSVGMLCLHGNEKEYIYKTVSQRTLQMSISIWGILIAYADKSRKWTSVCGNT